ncbi:hypothetical protein K144316041_p21690 (plasmid) [Clostridium tetani]|uniref:hypothetical protein n=1 Tax=Clostridium tetani TaxID=1513 RepID=UPI002952FB10|nr:hypothetical protein [Clostridium tetani]BDR74330.1 hypothetical protein K144316041_p21690 [Clostridium tetani]
MNEKIIMKTVIITENKIKINTDDTSYCNYIRREFIDVKALIKKHTDLVHLAKSKGCKVSYKNGYKKTLMELKEQYNKEYKEHSDTFNLLKELWIKKLEKGLYAPTSEDEELSVISGLDISIQKTINIKNVMEKVQAINSKINHYMEEFENDAELIKIVL